MISRFYILIFTVVVLAPLNLAMADSESKQTQALTKEVLAIVGGAEAKFNGAHA
jgi:hypothetical protein